MYDSHPPTLLEALPSSAKEWLLEGADPVEFPAGTRIFREGRRADHFWVVRNGSVRLDFQVPTHQPVKVETLHRGDLLGCSWLFPPYEWQFSAQAEGFVTAWEFDAAAVRSGCDSEPEFGLVLARHVARIIAHRLATARRRLLQVYGPHGLTLVPEGSP